MCVFYVYILCICVYLAACCRVVTPVSGLTPVTGVSVCVGGADALTTLRVTVPSSVITGACWEENEQPIRVERDDQLVSRLTDVTCLFTCAAIGMETVVTTATAVTLLSSHALHALALPLLIT